MHTWAVAAERFILILSPEVALAAFTLFTLETALFEERDSEFFFVYFRLLSLQPTELNEAVMTESTWLIRSFACLNGSDLFALLIADSYLVFHTKTGGDRIDVFLLRRS